MKHLLVALSLFSLTLFCEKNIVSECEECRKADTCCLITFGEIQQSLLTPQCVSCHGGSSPAANLNLEAGHAYDQLINVDAVTAPHKRVVPFKSSESYLVWALEGQKAPLMPPSGKINQAMIDSVVAWIDRGAPNN